MSLVDRVRARRARKGLTLPSTPVGYDALRAPLLSSVSVGGDRERIEHNLAGYISDAYKANGTTFACIAARQAVFSEGRFQWQRLQQGRPGDMFGDQALALLENPWPGGTTGNLLARMELDASLAGNFYATTADDEGRLGRAATGPTRRIVHARPDWVTILVGVPDETALHPYRLDARVLAYEYRAPGEDPVMLLPGEMVHYAPLPDPDARFRGMSWLTPILREVQADKAATIHKARFLENGAMPGMAVRFDKDTTEDEYVEFVESFRENHQGAAKANSTLFLLGGADVTVLGKDFKELDFSATQGKSESRIAAAAGVPPSWVGFSEGTQGSALNAGNFSAARRRFADGTIRPLWRDATAALQTLVPPPGPDARLVVDTRDIAFLREDRTDAAAIQGRQAQTIRTLIDAGYHAPSVVDAVVAENFRLLEHSGLFSVQLQEPGEGTPADPDPTNPPDPTEEQ
ncbi:phage portal protein [Nocardiopsis dassonvillei]|uniref:phage portal protein n=1 Tax=Nocardiopsis dassonvillei TaxID=2014 RepID=UPI0036FE21FD